MTINLSNNIVAAIYRYFTDMNERYTRKHFAAVLLASTLLICAIYGLGTDWTKFEELQVSTIQQVTHISTTENISHDDALNKLSQDQDVLEDFNNAFMDIVPSAIWLCLIMMMTIPAVIKRTNDCIFSRSSSYPVAIHYVLYTVQGITGMQLYLFGLVPALGIYTFFFIFIISLLPTHEDKNEKEEV
tara:strand:+ start:993 stop:1553 length:561 start_codon:yes stop_codon:yes gene_type:complete